MLTIIEQLHELPWADEFSHRALDKARRYAVENRVQVREMEDTLVLATCKGSQGNIYEQTIELIEDFNGEFELVCCCSCPVVVNCKHCATVLYHLQELPMDSFKSTAPVQLNRDLERWLNDVPRDVAIRDESAKSTGTCWVYKLRAMSTAGKWLLEICKARQLKDGRLQDIKPVFSPSEALMREPGYLSELDLRIARLLVAIHSYHSFYSGYPLQGSSGAEVLQLALKTSRLFLDFEQLQPLAFGMSRSAQFSWAEQASGSTALSA
ncbi:hypothetical protein [Pseudomonas sp. ZS1P83]